MKDSGEQIIGEIPDSWNLIRLKYLAKQRNEKALFSPQKDKYIGLENVKSYSDEIMETDSEYDESVQSVCKKGDVLFNKLRPYLAKVLIAPYDAFCTGEFLQFHDFNGDKRFLKYSLLNPSFIEIVNASTYGTKMPRANAEFICNLKIPLPPLPAQQKIADFLDAKCAGLDSLSADIRAQIGLLEEYKKSVITEAVTGKRVSHGFESGNAASLHSDFKGRPLGLPNPCDSYKDSGIEWIGEIPEGWEVKRIGQLYTERRQKVSDRDYPPLSVTMKGIVPQLETAAKSNAHDDRKLVLKGDFAINSRSDRRGSCGISDFDGSVSLINTVLTPLDNMNPKFYNWLFHTPIFADEFYKNGHGIVDDLWTTSWQEMKRISIPLPPLAEQTAIADYLDSVCAKIDSAVSSKRRQLETLDEYKKSLIFEYVTGKKEVSSDEFALQTSQGKEV